MLKLFPLGYYVILVLYFQFKSCADARHDTENCGPQYLNLPLGFLTSPGYPQHYREDIHCEWIISGDSNMETYVYMFAFEEFELEISNGCTYDYLEFYSVSIYEFEDPYLVARYCGYEKPDNITVVGAEVIVVFHSDTNNIESGFYLSWISYIQPDTNEETTTGTGETGTGLSIEGRSGNVSTQRLDVCPKSSIPNGFNSCQGGNNIDATCSFSCRLAYIIEGFPVSTCVRGNATDPARWMPPLPTCRFGFTWRAIAIIVFGVFGFIALIILCYFAVEWKHGQEVVEDENEREERRERNEFE